MNQGIFGKLFGDRGYISQDLLAKLYQQQLQLITRYKKNMKQKLVKLSDKILLRKRALIETVNDQLMLSKTLCCHSVRSFSNEYMSLPRTTLQNLMISRL